MRVVQYVTVLEHLISTATDLVARELLIQPGVPDSILRTATRLAEHSRLKMPSASFSRLGPEVVVMTSFREKDHAWQAFSFASEFRHPAKWVLVRFARTISGGGLILGIGAHWR